MNWNTLISAKRFGLEEFHQERHENRSEFQRDYDRLVFSAPFRRLQNKTQVFPLPGSVFVHNRLTHSLEVSCVGRSLGNDVSKALHCPPPGTARQLPHRNRLHRFGRLPGTRLGKSSFRTFGRTSYFHLFFRGKRNVPKGPTDTCPMGGPYSL